MDAHVKKMRFTVDRIEEKIAVCVCDAPLPDSGGAEKIFTVDVPAENINENLCEGDVFDAYFSGGVFSGIEMRPDVRNLRMQSNKQRLKNLFGRNKNS